MNKLENTEEFAKLDALLADLLSEVEEPILLNKNDDIERSVDYLNEQKEKLRSKKSSSNSILASSGTLFRQREGGNEIIFEEDEPTSLLFNNDSSNEPSRKIKSKLDYYVSNSNESKNNKQGFSYTNSNSLNKLHCNQYYNNSGNESREQLNRRLVNAETQTYQAPISSNSFTNIANITSLNSINKPPLSPNNRYYLQPHQNLNPSSSFRTITNVMRNINETDDDILNDADFDRSSIKSGLSTTSTIQRSKFHTISNNYVEFTRPQTTNNRTMQNKRAVSAPPTEIGKILLQRMELKSPFTIRTNIVPYDAQSQIDPSEHSKTTIRTNSQYPANRYNNRNLLKMANTLQPQPQRVYTRALSERPQTFNTGYDTDTGIVNLNNSYRMTNIYNNQSNNRNIVDGLESDTDSIRIPIHKGISVNRYNRENINGYDTDTGLILNKSNNFQNRPTIIFNRNEGYNSSLPRRTIERETLDSSNQVILGNSSNINPLVVCNTENRLLTSINDNNNNYNSNNDEINKESFKYSQNNLSITSKNNDALLTQEEVIQRVPDDTNQYNSYVRQQSSMPHDTNKQSAFQIIKGQNNKEKPSLNKDNECIERNQSNVNNSLSKSGQVKNNESSTNGTLLLAVNNNIIKNNNSVSNIPVDSRRSSLSSINDSTDTFKNLKFVKLSQNLWYKPKISREEAINLLKDKPAGTFLIRDSNNFPGAFGLALKVDKLPPNIPVKPNSDQSVELVRHFLIEPSNKGVRIKGCCNEPIFANLAALVYQHSVTPLALPNKLILPTKDLKEVQSIQKDTINLRSQQINNGTDISYGRQLLERGAACNVFYLNTVNVDGLTGQTAIAKSVANTQAFKDADFSQLILIQFKVNSQGIYITDLHRKKFNRYHYPTNTVLFCAIDDKQIWPQPFEKVTSPKIFGVICKPKLNSGNQECHLFVEQDPEQPAVAIVDFINRYLIPSKTQLK